MTQYLVDTQPALSKVLRESDGTNTTHFIHAPRGIFSQYDGTDWTYTAQDGLGSVRAAFDDTAAIQQRVNYSPVGVPDTSYDGFAFTGEQRDSNGLQYHRARYYDPALGIFPSLDPFEGMYNRPMSLNGYSWVEGNPIMNVDPSGYAIVEIWAAAFIEHEHITFPMIPDLVAIWEGDNRLWHTVSDFNKDEPLSSRVWWQVKFDSEDLSTVFTDEDTGSTRVDYHQ